MRCSQGQLGCGARFTLARAPHQYARSPRCPNCRSIHVHSVELDRRQEMRQRADRGRLCRCRSYPFPHELGTLRFCIENPQFMRDPTQTEERCYLRCLEVRRGGMAPARAPAGAAWRAA